MANSKISPTKNMFDCLARLYKQGQLLLMDADRLMGEKGWEPRDMLGPREFSNSLNLPERWYARWAVRFYNRIVSEENKANIDKLLFVSIHFASDHDSKVEEPVVSAGRLLYNKPMTKKEAGNSYYYYWMCKYWFWIKPHESLEGWRQSKKPGWFENLKEGEWFENLKEIDTFIVPLYDITSSERLEELVIKPLLSSIEQVV